MVFILFGLVTLIFGLPKSEEYLPKGLPVQGFWNVESPAQVKKRKENEQVACERNEQIKKTQKEKGCYFEDSHQCLRSFENNKWHSNFLSLFLALPLLFFPLYSIIITAALQSQRQREIFLLCCISCSLQSLRPRLESFITNVLCAGAVFSYTVYSTSVEDNDCQSTSVWQLKYRLYSFVNP